MDDGYFVDDIHYGPEESGSIFSPGEEVTILMISTGLSLGEALGEWLGDFVEHLSPEAQAVFDENYAQHTSEFTQTVIDAIETYAEHMKSRLLTEAQKRGPFE